jgi:adenylate cyclase
VAASPAFDKFADAKLRHAFEKGQIKQSGERLQAAVLHAHLHGVDRLSTHVEPEKLLRLLNEFHQAAVKAVEAHHGVVDHMHGGSIVAFWGVPKAQARDVQLAIEASEEIREAADAFVQAIGSIGGETPCRLGMGMHHGALAVGQMGSSGRMEYSAVGEAVEIASRIHQFADQFGTDFVMTGAAAARAGKAIALEQLTAGDESTPDLYELAQAESDQSAA